MDRKTKNTLRFWLCNRVIWLALTFFALMCTFCSGYDRELNLIFFFILFCLYCLAGAYITDNPNSCEYLAFKKFMDYMDRPDED